MHWKYEDHYESPDNFKAFIKACIKDTYGYWLDEMGLYALTGKFNLTALVLYENKKGPKEVTATYSLHSGSDFLNLAEHMFVVLHLSTLKYSAGHYEVWEHKNQDVDSTFIWKLEDLPELVRERWGTALKKGGWNLETNTRQDPATEDQNE